MPDPLEISAGRVTVLADKILLIMESGAKPAHVAKAIELLNYTDDEKSQALAFVRRGGLATPKRANLKGGVD